MERGRQTEERQGGAEEEGRLSSWNRATDWLRPALTTKVAANGHGKDENLCEYRPVPNSNSPIPVSF